ncbi:MAG TPA: hypothetical protein VGF69_13980 [Thermoanaerobaculia bacterium]|jgi:hypothetical protein
MLKSTAVSLALLLSVACASTPSQSAGTSSGTAATTAAALPNASNATEFVLLSSPNQVRSWDFSQSVYAFHVRGTMTNRGFWPAGEVQGRGKFCADGKDWLSFSDLKVHKAGEGTPQAPYVLGCATNSGFQPASRTIVTQ